MTTRDDLEATLPVAEAFEALGVPYYIGGSVASSMHGVGRSTIDVDLVARIEARHINPLVRDLQQEYYVDAHMAEDAIRNRSSFNLIHLATMVKIDVFVDKGSPFDRSGWERIVRGRPFEGSDREFPIASAEDVVLSKLGWYRAGGETSERQWNDIVGVVRMQREALDLDYLRKWAAQLNVADLLNRALKEAQT